MVSVMHIYNGCTHKFSEGEAIVCVWLVWKYNHFFVGDSVAVNV